MASELLVAHRPIKIPVLLFEDLLDFAPVRQGTKIAFIPLCNLREYRLLAIGLMCDWIGPCRHQSRVKLKFETSQLNYFEVV